MSPVITATEFEELYRATAADLFAFVRRRSAADAEEIVAETYAVAWRRREDLPPPMTRRPWLFGVARNLLKAQSRAHLREVGLMLEVSASTGGDSSEMSSEVQRVVTGALQRLTPAQREVLQLAAWEGLSPGELAVALGVRPGTARVRLHRARQALASDPEFRQLRSPTEGPDCLAASKQF